MAVGKPLSLTPATRVTLAIVAKTTPIRRSATHGVPDPDIAPLPTWVVDELSALGLRPSGFAEDRDPTSYKHWSFDQPTFAAQFAVAYHALANMLPGETSRDDLGSYGLKHAVERIWLSAGNKHSIYLTNGALIAAALAHDYRVRRRPGWDKQNAAVRLQRDWREVMLGNFQAVVAMGGR